MNASSSLPPAVGPGHTPTGFRFFEMNDRMLRLVRNSQEDTRIETHLCEIPIIYKDDAAFIVHACNTHAAHEARIAALVELLSECAKLIEDEYPEGSHNQELARRIRALGGAK